LEGVTRDQLKQLGLHQILIKAADDATVTAEMWVKVRPGAQQFIVTLAAAGYRLYVYTAGSMVYANSVLDVLDPHSVSRPCLIDRSNVFGREHLSAKIYKDVSLVEQHARTTRANILILDDRRDVWLMHGANQKNVLQVPPYFFFSNTRLARRATNHRPSSKPS